MKRILMTTAIVAAMTTGAYAQSAQTNTQKQPAEQTQQKSAQSADTSAGANAAATTDTKAADSSDTKASGSDSSQASATDMSGNSEATAGSGDIFAKVTSADSVKGDLKASALIGKSVYIPKAPEKAAAASTSAGSSSASSSGSMSTAGASGGSAAADPMSKLDDVGSVGDVILSKDGKVDAVLVDVGGFLGIGTHTVSLDWTALHWKMKPDAKSASDSYIVVNATKDQLEKAPAFKASWLTGEGSDQSAAKSASATAPAGAAATVDSNGQTTAAATNGQTMSTASNDASQKSGDMSATDKTGTTSADNSAAAPAASTDSSAQASKSADASDSNNTAAAASGSAASTQSMANSDAATDPMAKAKADGYTKADASSVNQKELTGAAVYDAKGNDIGKVSKVIVNASSNKIESAVVNVGGFLGIGQKSVQLTADQMNVMTKDGGKDVRVYVTQTETQLKQMPEYKQG